MSAAKPTNAELADVLEAVRYASRSIKSSKPVQDRAERRLEQLMRINAKQIIRALRAPHNQRDGNG